MFEALESKYAKYFETVLTTMNSLIQDNKVQPLNVDIKNIGCPDKPFLFDNLFNDKNVKEIVGNKFFGFTVINQMIRNPRNYLIDNDKELKPDCYPFSYMQNNNMYLIGLSLFDKNVSHIDGFIHLVGIETSLVVAESAPVLKEMLKQSIKTILKNDNKYIGITAKPTHPKMKATLIKIGFGLSKENKELLTYKI